MSLDLYKKLCGWLLDWNTSDGVFGHCFLVLTWNLSCHAHNTANIQLCEIEWSSTFDAFEICFAHMKMDQTGDKAKYSHHLYSNPCCPLICPVLAPAFYFSFVVTYHRMVSPGCSWDGTSINGFWRCYLISFGIMRQRCLNWGKSQNDEHTLNKERSCYLHVVPSWWSINFISMYSCWVDHGDCEGCLYVVFIIGRSVCWLLSGNVAIIVDGVCIFPPPPPPPNFGMTGETYSAQQFPMFDDVPQFLHLKLMCLASMVKHRWFIVECFNANHVVLASGQLFRDEELMHQLDNNPDCIVVTYPWSSNGGSFMGVPKNSTL